MLIREVNACRDLNNPADIVTNWCHLMRPYALSVPKSIRQVRSGVPNAGCLSKKNGKPAAIAGFP